MKYSDTLRWFYEVQWNEQGDLIDCLVDITELDAKEGYTLVKENNRLRIYLSTQVRLKDFPERFTLLGKVIKRDYVL